MRVARPLIVALCLLAGKPGAALSQATTSSPPPGGPKKSEGPFLVKPYLQWGDSTAREGTRSLAVLWHTGDDAKPWSVEFQPGADQPWRPAEAPTPRRIAVPGIPPHRLYRAILKNLVPGARFSYRLSQAGQPVFQSDGRAPKAAAAAYRFVAFGDCGAGTP
ncbi:MAG TPA: fibronectin type III domain-containing protein, partial [Isosphaeraceae bacterium]|nr:fibronectin type III domain-containing protein [Isosphaeraceae bacterium]